MNKLQTKCDSLWLELIKLKAGYCSEISDKEGTQIGGSYILNAHHINNKPNFHLRYSLENGICLTQTEHKYEAHANDTRKVLGGKPKRLSFKGKRPYEEFKQKVRDLRGEDIYERLDVLKHDNTKLDLNDVKEMLEEEIKKYGGI